MNSTVRFLLTTAVFLLVSFLIHAQDPPKLINSAIVIEQGKVLYDSGRYKEALGLFKTVSRSDTNYIIALQEMCLSAYRDSNYSDTKEYALQGLKRFPEKTNEWYRYTANAFNGEGKINDALSWYDKIIENDPNDYSAYYNKGYLLYEAEKFGEAKILFQKGLLINPYYAQSHFFLGRIALQEGNIIAAMLSFLTNLGLDPSNGNAKSSIVNLNHIALVNDEVLANAQKYKFTSENNFEAIQEIVLSKIALDKEYKLQTEVEDVITRQIQVVMEKLEYNKNDKGFWMQFYVPFYTNIFKNKMFNPMVNFLLSGISVKEVDNYIKNNKSAVDEFTKSEVAYYNDIRDSHVLDLSERAIVKQHYYFNNGSVYGKGEWIRTGREKKLTGPWQFFYDNGKTLSKGSFNSNEDKDGPWIFYYNTGSLKEKSNFKNGMQDGESELYFENGIMSASQHFNLNKEDGENKIYYFNGILHASANFVDGKKDGLGKWYKSTGELDYTSQYKNDKKEGTTTYYHENGKISSIQEFKNGEEEGAFKKYDETGASIETGFYKNGKADGNWKTFYPSGKPKETFSYDNGLLEGSYVELHENGKPKQQFNYKKGKQDGEEVDYDEDGSLFSKSSYEKGRLYELKFFDKSGKEISSVKTKKGSSDISIYDPWGNKTFEGLLSKTGEKDGIATYYYRNGRVSQTEQYNKGSLEGNKISFFRNGIKSSEINYNNNEENGYFTSYFENGKTKYGGWVVKDLKQGEHIVYNESGKILSKIYYKNNLEDGYSQYYNQNGKKDYEELYDEGWVRHFTQYDSTGKIISEVDLPNGNAPFIFKYPNGAIHIKGAYKNYYLNGLYETFYFDGKPKLVLNFNNGRKDGPSKSYFYNGKVETDGAYELGKKIGKWNYYYDNGQVNNQEFYVNGVQTGKELLYNDDGVLEKEFLYKNNEQEGDTKYFGENGVPALVLHYHEGDLISYTYLDKNGQLKKPVELKNGTGLVESYYPNGKISARINFEDNRINGIRNLYFSTGKIYIEDNRLLDKENGIKKIYYPNGQLKSEVFYLLDQKNGIQKEWYSSGKLKAIEYYTNGELYGDCKYYDEQGNIKETKSYYFDNLLKVK